MRKSKETKTFSHDYQSSLIMQFQGTVLKRIGTSVTNHDLQTTTSYSMPTFEVIQTSEVGLSSVYNNVQVQNRSHGTWRHTAGTRR